MNSRNILDLHQICNSAHTSFALSQASANTNGSLCSGILQTLPFDSLGGIDIKNPSLSQLY